MIAGIFNEYHHGMLTVIYPHERKCLFLDPVGESQVNMKSADVRRERRKRNTGLGLQTLYLHLNWLCEH
ncbi:hypothetical protein SKAU_G00032980 [Synaphobranchus kaupii]|uniref:Uncharacterized protein n=1 Tax=Synaphobranchus kaupii TaxID=118154 RepID=A0A9Q1GE71_SYNKA|nr:hypothetical protein SKAU_G00032980 [Synaphobranchus kaupii]